MDDHESTPEWKLNLSERAQHSSSRKAGWKDWIKLLYSSSLSPGEILHDKREVGDWDKQMDGDDDFFQIKDMEASSLQSLILEKITSIQRLKRWGEEERLDSIRHLFITAENDRPITEGQDWTRRYRRWGQRQWRRQQYLARMQITSPIRPRLLSCCHPPSHFDALNDNSESSHVDFHFEKRNEIAEGIDTDSRNLIGPTSPIHTYTTPAKRLKTLFPLSIVRSLLPAAERFVLTQVPMERHRWYSRTPKNNSLLYSVWLEDDSKVFLSILLTATPSACECLNMLQNARIGTLLSTVPATLPKAGFCFNSLPLLV